MNENIGTVCILTEKEVRMGILKYMRMLDETTTLYEVIQLDSYYAILLTHLKRLGLKVRLSHLTSYKKEYVGRLIRNDNL